MQYEFKTTTDSLVGQCVEKWILIEMIGDLKVL